MAEKKNASKVSGRYEDSAGCTLRLDVDGGYSVKRLVASGDYPDEGLGAWVADRLESSGAGRFEGRLRWIRPSSTNAAFQDIAIEVRWQEGKNRATLTRLPPDGTSSSVELEQQSPYFRDIELEVDAVEGVEPVTEIDTHAYNKPPMTRDPHLSIEKVFRQAGYNAHVITNGGLIPVEKAGSDEVWTDMELHDAMQEHWSRPVKDIPQWAVWVLFATRYEQNPEGMFGIMFDTIGEQHRQGLAIFNDSALDWGGPTEGDTSAGALKLQEAFRKRARFVIACHEIAHTFDLTHPFQREYMADWAPLPNDPEARTFLNYPRDVKDGSEAFYKNFLYRFADEEILYLRHAPEAMVQPGNVSRLQDVDPERTEPSSGPLALRLKVNRSDPYEYMEPVEIETKFTNLSNGPKEVPLECLGDPQQFRIFIQREWGPIREWRPFARPCPNSCLTTLFPGETIKSAISISTGLTPDGFYIAKPGWYRVRMALKVEDEVVHSNWLPFKVSREKTRGHQMLADCFFCEDVARILAFEGSRSSHLSPGNDVLARVAETKLQAALHARVALAMPLIKTGKLLKGRRIVRTPINHPHAREFLDPVLAADTAAAAKSFGLAKFARIAGRVSAWSVAIGRRDEAVQFVENANRVLKKQGGSPDLTGPIGYYLAGLKRGYQPRV